MTTFLSKTSKVSITLFSTFSLLLAASSVQAKTPEEYANILNLSGKQRMLTQKMSKEMLFIAKGINAADNQMALVKTASLFDVTLTGLEIGDASLNLPPADGRGIVKTITKVKKLWSEFKPLTAAAAGGNVDIAKIANLNLPLLKNSNTIVRLYEKEAKKATGKSSGIVINLAGKQRMLTQKMSKEALLISLGHEASDNQAKLRSTISLFDRTLVGLKNGDTDLDLPGTADTTILAQLSVVENLWLQLKPIVERISMGQVNDADLQMLFTANLPLLKEMNKAVSLFEKTSA